MKQSPILHWRGILAESTRLIRVVAAIVLTVAGAALTFTQLGFAGIGFNGDYSAYAIVVLLPVTLASFLLGVGAGTAMGFVVGSVLFVHSLVMPLDFYEATFITPVTSIVMLTVAGFFLGLFFALALRNNPRRPRRVVYIVLVCIIVSLLYSLGFIVNVIVAMLVDLLGHASASGLSGPDDGIVLAIQSRVVEIALRMGSVDVQIWADAALMAALTLVADVVAEKAYGKKKAAGLHAVFNVWLFIVMTVAFMVTAVISFAFVTEDDRRDALNNAQSEVNYLLNQLEDADSRAADLSDYFSSIGIDEETLESGDVEYLARAISTDRLLNGYTVEEDGIVLILFVPSDIETSIITNSDDEKLFTSFTRLSQNFSPEIVAAISKSIQNESLERVVYDSGYMDMLNFVIQDTDAEGRQLSEEVEKDPSETLVIETEADIEVDPTSVVDNARSTLAYVYAAQHGSSAVVVIKPAAQVFSDRGSVMAWTTISSFVLLLVVFSITSRLLNNLVVRRIDETNGVLESITKGDLDNRVEVHDTIEFSSLSDGINQTVGTLKDWIAEAESRMDAELAAAKAIQESALPRIFPPYPDIMGFDIYALMHAAREVGGDFYDFFLIGGESAVDTNKLGFLIADVSGKGIPAALFMMNAKALISGYMKSGVALGEAIENANRQLCDGNEEGMFVTLFAGVLDYRTNTVQFVNAGHNPPLLWQNGSWQWLRERSGLPLGLFEGLPYKAYEVTCEIGDQFLLYTDGVTEAMDAAGELFGEVRLEKLATDNFTLHPRALVEAVRRSVATYAVGVEQSDDITLLALEVGVPPEVTATLVVPASTDKLPLVNDFIHTELDRRLCPLRAQNQLDIAVEELFVNVAHYAYPDADDEHPGMVRISYTYSAEPPSVTVDIMDDGIPYNPLAKPDAVTPDDIMEVPIGGLGILMAKRSVDEMTYERLDGSNIVTIVKKW